MSETRLNSADGPRVEAALMELAAANDGISKGLMAFLRAGLLQGRFTDRHIRKVKETASQITKSLPAVIKSTVVESKKLAQIEFLIQFMNFTKHSDGRANHRVFIPSSTSLSLGPDYYIRETGILPIRFITDHLAFRFKMRASNGDAQESLDISSPAFHASLAAATQMAQSYGSKIQPEMAPQAIMIPHEKGLFIGYIEGMPAEAFSLSFAGMAREGKLVRTFSNQADSVIRPYPPQALITIKTFFDSKTLKPELAGLRAKLMEAFAGANRGTGSCPAELAYLSNIRVIDKFEEYAEWPKPVKQEISAYFGRLQQITQSSAWQNWAEKSRRNGHVPEESFYSLAKEQQPDHPFFARR